MVHADEGKQPPLAHAARTCRTGETRGIREGTHAFARLDAANVLAAQVEHEVEHRVRLLLLQRVQADGVEQVVPRDLRIDGLVALVRDTACVFALETDKVGTCP